MNLDAFWSRAKSTTLGNSHKDAFGLKLSTLDSLKGQYEAESPLPDFDHWGYEVTMEMFLHAHRSGKYLESILSLTPFASETTFTLVCL
jgi:hypothetical protein